MSRRGREIPALKRGVHNAALKQRQISMSKQAERVVNVCEAIHSMLSTRKKDRTLRLRTKEVFERAVQDMLLLRPQDGFAARFAVHATIHARIVDLSSHCGVYAEPLRLCVVSTCDGCTLQGWASFLPLHLR